MVEHVADTLLLLDSTGTIVWSSEGAVKTLGYVPDELVGLEGLRFVHPADLDEATAALAAVLAVPGATRRVTTRLRRHPAADGSAWGWFEILGRNELDHPELGAVVLSLRDVSDRMESEAQTNRLTEMLDATGDLVMLVDIDFNVIWANPTVHRLVPGGQPLGISVGDRVPPATTDTFRSEIVPALRRRGTWRGEIEILDAHDSPFPVDMTILTHRDRDNRVEYLSLIGRDRTEYRRLETRLAQQAITDELTGLANRNWFISATDALLARGEDDFAVLAVDIDQFKLVNDGHGHEIGDAVLREMALRLTAAVGGLGHVARSTGDEFFVLRRGVSSMEEARHVAEDIARRASGPFELDGASSHLTVSAGVVKAETGSSAATLLAEADTAMYRAKAGGRERVECFERSMIDDTRSRLTIARELRDALGTGALEPHFQPIVDAESREVLEVETLIRWRHPVRGLLWPSSFIDVAEDSDLITAVGAEVLDGSCRALVDWRHRGMPSSVSVGVNLSARELADPSIVDRLRSTLERHQVPAERLTVELTESLLMHDIDRTVATLHALRALGVRIAIDDFGTGYSSLAYLRDLPVDVLKIDRSFVASLAPKRVSEYSLIAGVVSIGHSLGLTVVAEGVETSAQADLLVDLGCDRLQGYLFSPPVAADAVPNWWRRAA